jgi:sporulation protein YlmC with PRC-barrel domain
MLFVASALKGFDIMASDGAIGTVSDFLFDDRNWKVRWMVVDTGDWLPGRKVLIHPSAIGPADYDNTCLAVTLTKAQVEASPDIAQDAPVSLQMEADLYGFYGWDENWGNTTAFDGSTAPYGGVVMPMLPYGGSTGRPVDEFGSLKKDGDAHLRSMNDIVGYHIAATDGSIGHAENFIVDENNWAIQYLIIDTKNWWIGQHVLITPHTVQAVNWSGNELEVNITQAQIKSSPEWDPAKIINLAYQKELHEYYGWPGYGW